MLILSAKEEDAPALEYTLELLKESGEEIYLCWNGWDKDKRDDFWKEKILPLVSSEILGDYGDWQNPSPPPPTFIDLIVEDVNDLNLERLVPSWNRGLRKARGEQEQAAIIPLKWPGESLNLPPRQLAGADVFLCKDYYLFTPQALRELGVLDQNFFEKLYLLDYLLRARIKGLNIKYTKEIPLQELTLLEQFDTLKLGTKWGVPEDIDPSDFWKWAEKQEYKWHPNMYIP